MLIASLPFTPLLLYGLYTSLKSPNWLYLRCPTLISNPFKKYCTWSLNKDSGLFELSYWIGASSSSNPLLDGEDLKNVLNLILSFSPGESNEAKSLKIL